MITPTDTNHLQTIFNRSNQKTVSPLQKQSKVLHNIHMWGGRGRERLHRDQREREITQRLERERERDLWGRIGASKGKQEI